MSQNSQQSAWIIGFFQIMSLLVGLAAIYFGLASGSATATALSVLGPILLGTALIIGVIYIGKIGGLNLSRWSQLRTRDKLLASLVLIPGIVAGFFLLFVLIVLVAYFKSGQFSKDMKDLS